ncbi:hypothetical protein G3H63_15565 [Microbacterium resistens]|uniref:hypothetical protein n=1 Tax=Microbacterium resistens TaxID=156977 RepID=UPI001C55E95B|nr:hypothetical protein [Microbacterium resistens]MBW1640482.1 hypothetical protein [Microbacterium resistens]
MPSREVLSIIASLDGGFNGEVYTKQIGVEIVSDTEAIYTLTCVTDEPPTVERYRLQLTPLPAD